MPKFQTFVFILSALVCACLICISRARSQATSAYVRRGDSGNGNVELDSSIFSNVVGSDGAITKLEPDRGPAGLKSEPYSSTQNASSSSSEGEVASLAVRADGVFAASNRRRKPKKVVPKTTTKRPNAGGNKTAKCPPNYMILNIDTMQPLCTGNFEIVKGEPYPNLKDHMNRPFFKNEHGMYLHFWVGKKEDINNWICGPKVGGVRDPTTGQVDEDGEDGLRGYVESYINGNVNCPDEGEISWKVQAPGGTSWRNRGDKYARVLVMQTNLAKQKLENAKKKGIAEKAAGIDPDAAPTESEGSGQNSEAGAGGWFR